MNSSTENVTSALDAVTNDTSHYGEEGRPAFERSALSISGNVVFTVLSVVGIFANLLVMVVVVRNKKLHRAANYYIVSMSVNDALCCFFAVNGLNAMYATYYWTLGDAACWIYSFFDFGTSMTSLLHMILLAWDRHEAIVTPLKYSSPNKKIRIAISIAATYAISFGMILGFHIRFLRLNRHGGGWCSYDATSGFYWVFTLLANVIPFVLMNFFYIRCAVALHRQYLKLHPVMIAVLPAQQQQIKPTIWKQALNALTSASGFNWSRKHKRLRSKATSTEGVSNSSAVPATEVATISVVASIPDGSNQNDVITDQPAETNSTSQQPTQQRHHQNQQQQHTDSATMSRRHQQHVRHIRTLAIILASFLILSGPYTCCSLYTMIGKGGWRETCTTDIGDLVIYTAPYFQAGINPILVIVAQKQFRQAVWNLFTCSRDRK